MYWTSKKFAIIWGSGHFNDGGVIGVADALAGTGFTVMVGDAVAGVLGSGVSPFVFIVAFALLTSTCATFTGSNMGSVYILPPSPLPPAPALLNPTAAAIAVVISGWNGGYMPIDGMPAMILGMGKYKLPNSGCSLYQCISSAFWRFVQALFYLPNVFRQKKRQRRSLPLLLLMTLPRRIRHKADYF